MDIGQKLITLRTSQAKSQYALAKESGVKQPSLLDIERGKVTPNVTTLEKLCHALGITLSDFFSDEAQAAPPLELELIAAFRTLPLDKQEQAVRLVRNL